MKLQKQFAYKYKEKEYFKHMLTIPGDTLRELGWKPGVNLEQVVDNGKLVIKPCPQETMQISDKKETHRLASDKKLLSMRGE